MIEMTNRIAIVIPYYHNSLTDLERISWLQALKIFKRYQIIAIVPDDMVVSDYPQALGIKHEVVPAAWMHSVQTYNQMMVEIEFYNRFLDYEYILIYQLDAFVFRDELQDFCQLGYDYIGAPWMYGAKYFKDLKKGAWYVGNGGLSLRNVSASLDVLSKYDTRDIRIPEDVFWASCNSDLFKVAPREVALRFSFERDIRYCYEKNAYKLPFGCHAWEKHDLAFWKPLIEAQGYNITTCSTGDLDVICPAQDFRYLNLDGDCIQSSYMNFFGVSNTRIYIWGAGRLGEECGWLLIKAGIDNFEYIDANLHEIEHTLWDRAINSPEILKRSENLDALVIIAIGKDVEDVNLFLTEYGFKENDSFFLFAEWRNKLRELFREKSVLGDS